jgi:sugar phosphate isomerase/epimerase
VRHRDIPPDSIWGDGDPEGIRQGGAEEIENAARAAARLGAKFVIGFTGSSIWKYVAMSRPLEGAPGALAFMREHAIQAPAAAFDAAFSVKNVKKENTND